MRSVPFYFGITRGIGSTCGKDSPELELESKRMGEFKEQTFCKFIYIYIYIRIAFGKLVLLNKIFVSKLHKFRNEARTK